MTVDPIAVLVSFPESDCAYFFGNDGTVYFEKGGAFLMNEDSFEFRFNASLVDVVNADRVWHENVCILKFRLLAGQ